MTEAFPLRNVVTQALRALGFPWRELHGALVVDVPPPYRRFFRRGKERTRLELVFDLELWAGDRSVELVVPGSAVLDGLATCLRMRGATRAIQVGGDLAGDGALLDRWRRDFSVDNGALREVHDRFVQRLALRYVYEVRLPGPPPVTELIPVIWDLEERSVMSPQRVAALRRSPWYGETEVRGVLRASIRLPSTGESQQARRACDQELQRRVARQLSASLAQLTRDADQERQDIYADLQLRLAEAEHDADRRVFEEEASRRVERLDRLVEGGLEATLSTEALLVRFAHRFELDYAHARSGEAARIRPRVRAGHLLDAQCQWCDEPRHAYLLAEPSQGALACTVCAIACRDATCDALIRRSPPPEERSPDARCLLCEAPAWCRRHQEVCAHCGTPACPDHRRAAACCGRAICADHLFAEPLEGRSICADHGRVCSADGRTWWEADGVTCPVTGEWFAAINGRGVPEDGRLLHPRAYVTCPTSGVELARDKAIACAGDGRLHHPGQMLACDKTGAVICPEHRARTTLPPAIWIDAGRLRTSAETGLTFDVTAAEACTVSGQIYHRSELLRCPIARELFHPSAAAPPRPDDPRRLHPSAVVSCAQSGRPIAIDRAVEDGFRPGVRLHPASVGTCQLSGRRTASGCLVELTCCGRLAARGTPEAAHERRLIALADDRWACDDHYGRCVVGDHPLPLDELSAGAPSGRLLCVDHQVRCDCHGDIWEPQATWASPYDHARRYCPRTPQSLCSRCGLTFRSGDAAGECEWCQAPIDLRYDASPLWLSYAQNIRPLLPWYQIRLRVIASGTASAACFELVLPFGGRERYVVIAPSQVRRLGQEGAWKEVGRDR